MAKDEGNILFGAEVSDPVPGEHAFYGNHNVLSEGGDDAEESFRVCLNILMNPDLASGIEDADKHIFGMQIDSTIKLVLLGVKFHIGFLLLMGYGFFATLSLPSLGGGLK